VATSSTSIPSTAELLLRADWERPRSKQTALGMSDLGGCRRRAGYQYNGYPPEKPSGSVQAVIGTSVHDTADTALRMMRDRGLLPANSVINEEVRFGGLIGHPDLYVDGVLRDIKTIGYDAQLANYKLKGPPRRHLWQVMTYAAALIVTERPVHTVQLDYLVRDSGNSWLWEAPFDYMAVREAMVWLDLIRQTPLEYLARDFAPDSAQCRHCPFFGACWDGHVLDRDERSAILVEDQDAVGWAKRLEDARARLKAAKEDEALAKGVLDALRPNDTGKGEVKLDGYEKILKWTVSERKNLDAEAVRADYARGGSNPPVTTGSSVKLELLAPRDDGLQHLDEGGRAVLGADEDVAALRQLVLDVGVELDGAVDRVGAAVSGEFRGEQHGCVRAGDQVDCEAYQFLIGRERLVPGAAGERCVQRHAFII